MITYTVYPTGVTPDFDAAEALIAATRFPHDKDGWEKETCQDALEVLREFLTTGNVTGDEAADTDFHLLRTPSGATAGQFHYCQGVSDWPETKLSNISYWHSLMPNLLSLLGIEIHCSSGFYGVQEEYLK